MFQLSTHTASINTSISSKQFKTSLTLAHLAMTVGQLFFALLAFFLVQTGNFQTQPELKEILQVVVPLSVPLCFGASQFLFKTLLDKAQQASGLSAKLLAYQKGLLLRFATLEAVSFLGTVSFLLSGFYPFLLVALATTVFFAFIRPTSLQLENDLNLTLQEKDRMNNPNAIVAERTFRGFRSVE